MVYCCAFNCTNRLSSQKRLQEGIIFHSFPKDEDRRKRWLANIRREFFTLTAYTRICSQYFEQKMLDRTGQTTRLRQDVVPTLFDFPSNLKKASTQRAPPKDRAAASTTCTSSDSLPATLGQQILWRPRRQLTATVTTHIPSHRIHPAAWR